MTIDCRLYSGEHMRQIIRIISLFERRLARAVKEIESAFQPLLILLFWTKFTVYSRRGLTTF